MKNIIKLLFFLLISGVFACGSQQKMGKGNSGKPMVVLKLDDLWFKNGQVHPGWQQVVDFLNEQNITGTIGLIGESLEDADASYYQWIKKRHKEGHEIWHHGYCHCKPAVDGVEKREFRGTDYTYQLEQLSKAQQLAREKLGIKLRSFGAPYNSTDANTPFALGQITEIKVWMYKETSAPSDKFIIKRISEVNIEYPVHVPDFEKFKAGYEAHKNEPILIIQGHPRSWVEDKKRFETFRQIVRFLQAEGVQFTTPYAYYQQVKKTL